MLLALRHGVSCAGTRLTCQMEEDATWRTSGHRGGCCATAPIAMFDGGITRRCGAAMPLHACLRRHCLRRRRARRPHPHRGAKDRHARLGARHHPRHGLDKAANLDIQVVELASTEAGKIALRSGSADMIVSDWLWVARERSLGDNLVFYPYTEHARRRDDAGQFARSPISLISRARSSRSPAVRSTRAG